MARGQPGAWARSPGVGLAQLGASAVRVGGASWGRITRRMGALGSSCAGVTGTGVGAGVVVGDVGAGLIRRGTRPSLVEAGAGVATGVGVGAGVGAGVGVGVTSARCGAARPRGSERGRWMIVVTGGRAGVRGPDWPGREPVGGSTWGARVPVWIRSLSRRHRS